MGCPCGLSMVPELNQFRLTVWRPLPRDRDLMAYPRRDQGEAETIRDQLSYEFHEPVYSWEPKGIDIWGSLCSGSDTQRLQTLLIESFSSHLSPERRAVGNLEPVLRLLAEVLNDPARTGWADSEDVAEVDTPEPINLRANTIAVLYNHLCWLFETFRHVPGASVTLR